MHSIHAVTTNYDDCSGPQAAAIHRQRDTISNSLRNLTLPKPGCPLQLVDYGCASGKNSIRLSEIVEWAIRRRGFAGELVIIRNDNSAADLRRLTRTLHRASARQSLQKRSELIAPGSFFRQVVPSDSSHVGLSTTAVHWLSVSQSSSAASRRQSLVRRSASSISASDWSVFLRHRARELKPGAKLIVTMPSRSWDSSDGLNFPLRCFDSAIRRLRSATILNEHANLESLIPVYLRSLAEVAQPLSRGRTLARDWKLETLEEFPVACPLENMRSSKSLDEGPHEAYLRFLRGFSHAAVTSVITEFAGEKARRWSGSQLIERFYEEVARVVADALPEGKSTTVHIRVVLTRRIRGCVAGLKRFDRGSST